MMMFVYMYMRVVRLKEIFGFDDGPFRRRGKCGENCFRRGMLFQSCVQRTVGFISPYSLLSWTEALSLDPIAADHIDISCLQQYRETPKSIPIPPACQHTPQYLPFPVSNCTTLQSSAFSPPAFPNYVASLPTHPNSQALNPSHSVSNRSKCSKTWISGYARRVMGLEYWCLSL
jgi:hypothetical protein